MKAVITIEFADYVEQERARLAVHELLGSLAYPYRANVVPFIQSTQVEWEQ